MHTRLDAPDAPPRARPAVVRPAPAAPRLVRVWDLPVRLIHWGLVACVTVSLATGFLAGAPWLDLHLYAGYAVLALVALRLVWGFTGSRFSRFASFPPSPGRGLLYLWRLLGGRAGHFLGHNPAGALMVYALLAVLAGLAASGLVVLGGELKQGPLAGLTAFATGRLLRPLHELAAYLLLGLIFLHVVGVLAGSLLERQNLVRAMLTGWKSHDGESAGPEVGKPALAVRARPVTALAILAGLACLAAPGLVALYRLPPLGVASQALEPGYARACGDCHGAFHPTLAPAGTWRAVMAGLADHFGEDASLPEAERQAIESYLVAHAAETSDSLPANVLRQPSATEPLRITATGFWKRRHGHLPDEVFARKSVTSRSNCAACHRDAASGRFAPQAIAVPGP